MLSDQERIKKLEQIVSHVRTETFRFFERMSSYTSAMDMSGLDTDPQDDEDFPDLADDMTGESYSSSCCGGGCRG